MRNTLIVIMFSNCQNWDGWGGGHKVVLLMEDTQQGDHIMVAFLSAL